MKKIHLLTGVLALFFLAGCNSDSPEGRDISTAHIDPDHPPVMTFDEPEHDFGKISQGQLVKYSFNFTNTGESDLVIQSARGSCGCTVPKSWPEYPVKPGESGKVEVQFNSEHKSGKQNVTITILANTVPTKNEVKLVGEVNAPSN